MTEPALPWAHRVVSDADAVQLQAETEQSLLQVEQADDDHFLTLETAGVSVGGRIEVRTLPAACSPTARVAFV